MKRVLVAVVLSGGLAASLAFATGTTANLTEKIQNTLTTIDTVPTKAQLEAAFDNGALGGLSQIARDKTVDIGVRLRAIHGLGKFCPLPCSGEIAHESLRALIAETFNETTGEPVVVLRAAIETLGALRVASDVDLLTDLLDHPSRDIRAATARALRDLCNRTATTPLRNRFTNEPTEQVKLAISEALRTLDQCGI